MSSVLNILIVATSLVVAGIAPSNAEQTGFIEGHLKIISPRVVEPSDEMPRQTVTAETYAEYLLIISSQEGKEITRFTADENGNYRVPLSPGAYILDVQDRAAKRVRAKPQPFTVASNQTVRVDMSIIIGFRKPAQFENRK
jgi:hypothetical protein